MRRNSFRPDPKDFIIVVMGPTGSGKSNFINAITGNAERQRASKLRSDTRDIISYPIFMDDGARIVLVDTPGFDDTYRPDSEILRLIADWLIQKYPNGKTLNVGGIIYLHRINDNRISGSAYRNLQLFGRLCGDLPLRRTRLVTTMWDKAKDTAIAERREKQLTGDFWKPLIDKEAVSKRFINTNKCAWDIVRELTDMERGDKLLLQEELVEQKKRLNETEAGKVLYSRFQKLLVEQKKLLKSLAEEAEVQEDPAQAKSLWQEYEKVNVQMQITFDEMNKTKITFFRRIILRLFGGKSRAHAVKLDKAPTGL